MNRFSSLALISMVLVLSACKSVKIENGEVPTNYLPLAKKLEGIYNGRISGIDGQLVIRFEGNIPKVDFLNNQNTDIVGNIPACKTEIGNLTEVNLKGDKENPQVDTATFKILKGTCGKYFVGSELYLTFKNNYRDISASYLKEYRQERRCTWDPGAPPHVPPREVCNYESTPIYGSGSFRR